MTSIYVSISIYSNAFLFQFACAAIAVRDRFNLLHEKVSSKQTLNNNEVDLVIKLYEKLFNAIKLINESFSFQLIPIMAFLLTFLVLNSYSLVRLLILNSIYIYDMISSIVISLAAITGIIMILVHASVSAVESAEKIFVVAYEISKQRKIFNYESKHQFKEFIEMTKRMDF